MDTTFEWLRCETEQPVDDLLLGTSRGGLVFCNVKRSLTLGAGDSSDLPLSFSSSSDSF